MPLQKSADKLRKAAEREATSGKERPESDRARRQGDSAAAEVHPEITSRKHSTAKPRHR